MAMPVETHCWESGGTETVQLILQLTGTGMKVIPSLPHQLRLTQNALGFFARDDQMVLKPVGIRLE